MKRIFRIGIPILVVICLVGGAMLLVKQKKTELGQTPAYGARPRPVTVAVAEKRDLAIEKQYLAVVEPARQAEISARVTAVVENIRVDEGDWVKTGEVLAELDAKETENAIDVVSARIEQAEAELAGNRATVTALEESNEYWQVEKKRAMTLAEKGAISTSESLQTAEKAADIRGKFAAARNKSVAIEKQIEALKKQKDELATRRGYYILRSPFDGIVTGRLADPGDMAAPSKKLITVQDHSGVKISFGMPQKDLTQVNKGAPVVFTVNGRTRQAEINLMYPTIDKAKMMRAEVWLDQEAAVGLTPGAYVSLTVIVEQLKNVVLVPASALIESSEGKTHVFTADGDSLSAVSVKVLGRSGDKVAVSGIDAETRVIENTYLGWATLSSGQKVEVVE